MAMSTPTPTLAGYREDIDDEGTDLRVEVTAGEQHIALEARAVDGVATVEMINPKGDMVLRRKTFDIVATAVDELRDRGFEVDLGALGALGVNPVDDLDLSWGGDYTGSLTLTGTSVDPEDSSTNETHSVSSVVDSWGDDLDGEDGEVWCGICGKGPYQSLGIHHGQMHKGEDKVALDHEPDPGELGVHVGDQDEDGGDAVDGDEQEDVDDEDDDVPLPPWLDEHPTDVIEDSSINRSLEDVLREVERQDSILGIQQRLAAGTTKKTKELLTRLGLTAPGDNELIGEAQRATRVPILRAIASDGDA
ncbi:hypothetical protein C453_12856 [Haloferax elongans ATCC BAA-1513]|uniref:Uncharacterized protein n=1 Tax=Haloferax elongans ATCC BAA-1513 TaxID=1230453 RepID=M0HIW5_HALEO|nr:hypothetical protein [Haloferax elongans]ELZ84436.1 hypothetical protein C453_12856 [Haloferax elongans ATCC BAA-1513]